MEDCRPNASDWKRHRGRSIFTGRGVLRGSYDSDQVGSCRKPSYACAKALAEISGPYAFVYHDASNGILFFGRDFLGRRSLLTLTTADGDLLISSVAGEQCKSEDPPWFEVEADGVYYVDLYADILVRKVPYHFADMNTEESTLSVGLPDASELL